MRAEEILAGDLNREIKLRRYETQTNDFGEAVEVWRDLAIVMAKKDDVRDAERFSTQEVASQLTARFLIRYAPRFDDLSPRDRLIYRGREHDIKAVKEIGFEFIEITAAARSD